MRNKSETKQYPLLAAIDRVGRKIGVHCPAELFAGLKGPAFQHDSPVYFANESAYSTATKFIGSAGDDFAAEACDGYLAFGYTGHGVLSWGYCMQSNSPDLMLTLRLACGGFYLPADSFERVNDYLVDLTIFVRKIRSVGLSLEVVESMGYGRYRLFDSDGHGVEREMTLSDDENRVAKLNRLLAEIGVNKAQRAGTISEFRASSDRLNEWQYANPAGLVMVFGDISVLKRPVIHSAGCPSMIEEQQPSNRVICASDMHQLLDWAEGKSVGRPALCSICFTLKKM